MTSDRRSFRAAARYYLGTRVEPGGPGVPGDIVALEKKCWNAIKEKDSETAASLSSDLCVVVGAQGVSEIDKTTLANMMKASTCEAGDPFGRH